MGAHRLPFFMRGTRLSAREFGRTPFGKCGTAFGKVVAVHRLARTFFERGFVVQPSSDFVQTFFGLSQSQGGHLAEGVEQTLHVGLKRIGLDQGFKNAQRLQGFVGHGLPEQKRTFAGL